MRSTIISLATMAGMAAAAVPPPALVAAYPSTCTVPTVTYNGNVATVTQTFTSTYCPKCPSVVTTYTTVYDAFCPTGLTQNVYTVTETCAPDSCRTGVPPGFVQTVNTCNVCGPTPVTATLTQPATTGSYATVTQAYPVVYQNFGSSGLVDVTYTAVASCAAAPCPMPVNNNPAPGFSATVSVCNTCAATPITATLTVPTAVVQNVPNAGTPVGGVPAAGTPAANNPAGGVPAGNVPAQGTVVNANPSSPNQPATYTGAAAPAHGAGSFVAAGLVGVAAVAQLL